MPVAATVSVFSPAEQLQLRDVEHATSGAPEIRVTAPTERVVSAPLSMQIPAGKHRLWLSIADDRGRRGVLPYSATVDAT